MAADGETDEGPPIESVDWDALDEGRLSVPWLFLGFLAAMGLLWNHYQWVQQVGNVDPLVRYPSRTTWVFRASLILLAFIVVPRLVRNRRRTVRLARRFARNRLALLSAAYLAAFFLVGLFSTKLVGNPLPNLDAQAQAPVFLETAYTEDCVGTLVDGGAGCRGSWQYPLGTNDLGQSMVPMLVYAVRVSLQMAIIATAIMVPLATVVGVTAGYLGGWTDTVLMRYVDVQQAVPAFVVYLILLFVYGESLLLIVAVFGLLNWGNIARMVRTEVQQRRSEQYIEVARSAGVGHLTIVRRHVLPNVSNSVLVGATQKIPQLVLIETGIAYLKLGDWERQYPSFGNLIREGFAYSMGVIGPPPMDKWWTWVFPAVVLGLTVISLSVFGDALRDVLDPRGESQ